MTSSDALDQTGGKSTLVTILFFIQRPGSATVADYDVETDAADVRHSFVINLMYMGGWRRNCLPQEINANNERDGLPTDICDDGRDERHHASGVLQQLWHVLLSCCWAVRTVSPLFMMTPRGNISIRP